MRKFLDNLWFYGTITAWIVGALTTFMPFGGGIILFWATVSTTLYVTHDFWPSIKGWFT